MYAEYSAAPFCSTNTHPTSSRVSVAHTPCTTQIQNSVIYIYTIGRYSVGCPRIANSPPARHKTGSLVATYAKYSVCHPLLSERCIKQLINPTRVVPYYHRQLPRQAGHSLQGQARHLCNTSPHHIRNPNYPRSSIGNLGVTKKHMFSPYHTIPYPTIFILTRTIGTLIHIIQYHTIPFHIIFNCTVFVLAR